MGGRIWAGLGKAAQKGKVVRVSVCPAEVMKKGRIEDLKSVWKITEDLWRVESCQRIVWIVKEDGTENGWRKIKRILESEGDLGPEGDLDSDEEDS